MFECYYCATRPLFCIVAYQPVAASDPARIGRGVGLVVTGVARGIQRAVQQRGAQKAAPTVERSKRERGRRGREIIVRERGERVGRAAGV